MKKPRKPYKPKAQHNTLLLFGAKQLVGQADADAIALPLMIHLDAAHRDAGTDAGCNFMARHLIVASLIAARTRSQAFYEQVQEAFAMLKKSAARDTKRIDLTTGEYTALRAAFAVYLQALPKVEVGLMAEAWRVATERLGAPIDEREGEI